MHNNYFVLLRLTEALNRRINGYCYGEIFSQNKDELIVGLYKGNEEFYIKALLSPLFSCLSFPSEFQRAKKNSVDLFPELIGKSVDHVEVFENDRSFRIISGDYSLVLKLYGNRSNLLLFRGDDPINLYKQKFEQDKGLKLFDFGKSLDLSFDRFQAVREDAKQFIPTLGKELGAFLENEIKREASPEQRWTMLLQYHRELQSPHSQKFRLCMYETGGVPQLSLIKQDNARVFEDPVEANTVFFNTYTRKFFLHREKTALIQQHRQLMRKAEAYIDSAEKKLFELENLQKYDQLANIIMANLHQIPPGAEEVELFDFYHDKSIKVRLKKGLTPQKNAENLYRKAKNQKIEIDKLKENIEQKKEERDRHLEAIMKLEEVEDVKGLKQFRSENKKEKPVVPEGFHRFSHNGFEILVGKNARRNDELTFKVAHKNDLWLHAKDSPGSHVVIRHIPGNPIGQAVLEKAASLAAWYSKRKTEALVPVSYTERKFVRKTKDLAPGQVIVEKEKVILAEPVNWTSG